MLVKKHINHADYYYTANVPTVQRGWGSGAGEGNGDPSWEWRSGWQRPLRLLREAVALRGGRQGLWGLPFSITAASLQH